MLKFISMIKGDSIMPRIVEVKNVTLGEGMPKICVPLVGHTNDALFIEVNNLKTLKLDIVEWRMDYHENVEDIAKMTKTLAMLRQALGDLPLLATFRSHQEGGAHEVSIAYYTNLNKALIATGLLDLIDVELFMGDETVKDMVTFAHDHGVKVIISNHDFGKTPSKATLVERLCKMQSLGADLPKIAVMPHTSEDVLTLLCATHEMVTQYANRPIITMSMAGLGAISRLSGEVFGSALTFGAAKTASAPGQIPTNDLAHILDILHQK